MFETPILEEGGSSLSSNSVISFSGSCDSSLMNLFQGGFRPFLRNNCATCHTAGPGLGQFAHPDFPTSYNAFKDRRTRISSIITGASQHPVPLSVTGPQHQNLVEGWNAQWITTEVEAARCAGTTPPGSGLKTVGKSNPAILTAAANPNTWTRVEWNLAMETMDTTLRNKIPLTAGIEIRVATLGGVRRGYEFRNPTIRINAGQTGPYRVTSLRVFINNELQQNVTTYSLIDASLSANTDTNISPGTSLALAVRDPSTQPIAATDTFALEWSDIKNAQGGSIINPGGPQMPPSTLPNSVTLTQLLSNDPMLGVFQQSCVGCHTAGNAQGGLNLRDPIQARNSRMSIYDRMNNAANPMPRSGLLLFQRREIVRIWRDGGGN
jgi:mono/diheme cytochrome c family protein